MYCEETDQDLVCGGGAGGGETRGGIQNDAQVSAQGSGRLEVSSL